MSQIMNREVTSRMYFCRDFACSVSTGGVYRGLYYKISCVDFGIWNFWLQNSDENLWNLNRYTLIFLLILKVLLLLTSASE